MTQKLIIFSRIFCAFIGLKAGSASAQFLQTDLNTFQLADPKKQVVVIATEIGVFVAYAPNRSTPLSGFDVQQLTTDNSTSAFIAYGPSNTVPERLVLPGAGNEFRIRGTFTLQLGKSVRVALATNANAVPYISVVNADKNQESIIGFVGRQVVLNLRGSEAVEMFEADPVRRLYTEVAPPYEIRKDNKLYLLEQPVPLSSAVGLFTQPENPCAREKAVIINERDLTKLRETLKPPLTAKRLVRGATKQKLASFLPLTISNETFMGIHYDTGHFVAIREEQFDTEKVCVVKTLQFKK